MFLLARWDPGYIVKGDHQPQRLDINLNPSSSSLSQVPDPSLSSSSHPQDPSSPTTNDLLNDNTSVTNPRDTIKSLLNQFKRTMDHSSFDDDKLHGIAEKLDNLHSELQQARILRPNARLPTQHAAKRARTRK